jgi:hypothetical protein
MPQLQEYQEGRGRAVVPGEIGHQGLDDVIVQRRFAVHHYSNG